MLLPGCFSLCCVPPPADFEHVCWVLVIGVITDRLQPKAPELPKPKGLPFRGWLVVADGRGGFKMEKFQGWCWKVHEKKVSEKAVMNTSKLDVHLFGPMLLKKQIIQHYLQLFVDLDAKHGAWMQITAFFTAKYSNNMSIQGFFSTIRQSFCVTKRHWLRVSGICIHVLWPFWATLADLGRQCRDAWCSNNSHGSGVEGNAPWEAPEKWRSNWAQNTESRVAAWWLIHRECSDIGCSRFVGWSGSDCHVCKKRSGSGNERWHPNTWIRSGVLPLPDGNFRLCLWTCLSACSDNDPWVRNTDWRECLWLVHLFTKHYHPCFSNRYWIPCLCSVRFFG